MSDAPTPKRRTSPISDIPVWLAKLSEPNPIIVVPVDITSQRRHDNDGGTAVVSASLSSATYVASRRLSVLVLLQCFWLVLGCRSQKRGGLGNELWIAKMV